MASSTLPRDYDIARTLADHEQRITVLERRLLLLQRASSYRVEQASDQNVTSSTTLVLTDLVVPVDGVTKIELEVRYGDGNGGGIRWGWDSPGAVTLLSRVIGAAGNTATGSPPDTSAMYWRNWPSLTGIAESTGFNTSSTNRISETLLVSGSGELTFKFAQQSASANTLTVYGDSHVLVSRVAQ